MPAEGTPAIATFGSMSSTATTSTDGATVTTHARSEITDLVVLDVVKIGSIVTDLTAHVRRHHDHRLRRDRRFRRHHRRHTGRDRHRWRAAETGDDHHHERHRRPARRPLGKATDSVNDLLAKAGIDIAVASPRKAGDENDGELTTTGLRIGFELSDRTFPALSTLLDQVPYVPGPPGAPTLGDLIALAQARHLVSLEIGRGQVALSATPGFSFEPRQT